MGVLPPFVSAHLVCAVPEEARRGHQFLWNWDYRQLLADMWVLGTESMSSERVASALNFRSISSAPNPPFLN